MAKMSKKSINIEFALGVIICALTFLHGSFAATVTVADTTQGDDATTLQLPVQTTIQTTVSPTTADPTTSAAQSTQALSQISSTTPAPEEEYSSNTTILAICVSVFVGIPALIVIICVLKSVIKCDCDKKNQVDVEKLEKFRWGHKKKSPENIDSKGDGEINKAGVQDAEDGQYDPGYGSQNYEYDENQGYTQYEGYENYNYNGQYGQEQNYEGYDQSENPGYDYNNGGYDNMGYPEENGESHNQTQEQKDDLNQEEQLEEIDISDPLPPTEKDNKISDSLVPGEKGPTVGATSSDPEPGENATKKKKKKKKDKNNEEAPQEEGDDLGENASEEKDGMAEKKKKKKKKKNNDNDADETADLGEIVDEPTGATTEPGEKKKKKKKKKKSKGGDENDEDL